MNKTVLVLRHLQFENLGILEQELIHQGYTIEYVEAPLANFSQLDAIEPDLLIVLGGPIGVHEEAIYPFLQSELQFIQTRLASKKPILGICLGAQLMARVLGAKVYATGKKEIGYAPLILTEQGQKSVLSLLNETPVLHWHGDQFEIPAGAQHLAKTTVCDYQAFQYQQFALGLQFHLEADAEAIELWLVGHACELAQAKINIAEIREQAKTYGEALKKAGIAVFRAWQQEVGL
ncbi:glutamine amidotransferase [Pelistega sp. MC2]|uniref:glutamine amidotransferase n=1 Tax=Pelistega sp. MC2 TaxID=1720297 RepID=UPI0008DA8B31|nr:glutamine amidotransferase [Pelistega sp. MC2]